MFREILRTLGFKNILVRPSKFAEDFEKGNCAKKYCLQTAIEKGKDVVTSIDDDYTFLVSSDCMYVVFKYLILVWSLRVE